MTQIVQYPNCGYELSGVINEPPELAFDTQFTQAYYYTNDVALLGEHEEELYVELMDPVYSIVFVFDLNIFTITVVCELSQAPTFDSSMLDIGPIMYVFGTIKAIQIPAITQVPACGFGISNA